MKDQQTEIIPVSEYKKTYVRNKKAKNQKKEEKVQLQICKYLREQYPDLIWQCDLASGLFLPPWIGAMHKKMRSSRGLPDLFIAKSKMVPDSQILVGGGGGGMYGSAQGGGGAGGSADVGVSYPVVVGAPNYGSVGIAHKLSAGDFGALPLNADVVDGKIPVIAISAHGGYSTIVSYKTYHGLFIEIKKEGIRKKDNSIPAARRKNKKTGEVIDHHAEQEAILSKLRGLGYMAEFASGFEEAKKLIDNYLR